MGLLPFGERDTGVNVDTVLFQHLRAFDTAVEQRAQQHTHNGEHQAKNNAAEDNQRFLRLQYARLGNGRVNNTHVADGTGFSNLQLLLFVQQLHIDLLTGFHVAGQTYNFLLRFWHRGDAVIKLRFFLFEGATFFQQRAIGRVTFGVELRNFRLFEGQLIKLRINVDHRIEHRFRFQRQIDGVFILTKRVQFVLCIIQTCAYFRELSGEEGQAFRRFSRLAFDVLLKVVAGNAVENFADLIFIFTGKGHAQDTRVLAIFGDRQVVLQIVDHPQG